MAAPHDTAPEGVVRRADVPSIARVAEERTVEQIVAGQLRRSILDGRLAPGERLRYRQLAAQLGVSVTPVRVALKELSSEGLVELRPHAGARVSSSGSRSSRRSCSRGRALSRGSRVKGAARLTDDGVSAMTQYLDDVRSATQALDRDGYLRTSWELRAVVYRAAERPRLLARVSTLYDFSLRYHHLNLADRERLARSLGYMEAFSDACAARDGPAPRASCARRSSGPSSTSSRRSGRAQRRRTRPVRVPVSPPSESGARRSRRRGRHRPRAGSARRSSRVREPLRVEDATSAHAPTRSTPRSVRPTRRAGSPVSRFTASSADKSRASRTMNRQNHAAHV